MMRKIVIGSRSSPLAQLQLQRACSLLHRDFGAHVTCCEKLYTSPGDRDKATDLSTASDDFFTADLDQALLSREIDCAVHSAKDLPPVLHDDIDFFCLPEREDPRDCWVGNLNLERPRIGVSSVRRIQWAKEQFPHAVLVPIRGTIEERLEQLDVGKYDLLIMAVAALNRLNLKHRIAKVIREDDLLPPDAQGFLAITFRKNDPIFQQLRLFYAYPVQLVGAGPGAEGYLTLDAQKALQQCEVCLYDALGSEDVLKYLPKGARKIYVGKRLGELGLKQDDICKKILYYARLGLKVVRLKGGDPGVFGRLAEEIQVLEEYKIDYQVIPGVSSVFAATTATGLLLTRRGIAKGFTVITPREALSGSAKEVLEHEKTSVAFMASQVADSFLSTFEDKSLPACAVFNASLSDELIISGHVGTLATQLNNYFSKREKQLPGLLLVGQACDAGYLFKHSGLLANYRVVVTCTQELAQRPISAIMRFGGRAIALPMIELVEKDFNYHLLIDYDYVMITSPTVAKIVLQGCLKQGVDFRKLPKIMTCGSGTTQTFKEYGIIVDAQPETLYGNDGLLMLAQKVLKSTDKVLRLQSDLASQTVEKSLSTYCQYTTVVIAQNRPLLQTHLPDCEALFFASSSAVRAFAQQFPEFEPHHKVFLAIGEPTENEIKRLFPTANIFTPTVATSFECIAQYAKKTCIF